MTGDLEGGRPFRSGFAALLGPANAGKSTLLNTVIGRKVSIVSHKPQTTRNRIVGVANREQSQIIFVDTPGFQAREGRGLLHDVLNASTAEGASDVDVHVLVIDGVRALREDGHISDVVKRSSEFLRRAPHVVAINKIDVLQKEDLLPLLDRLNTEFGDTADSERPELIPISAQKGTGLDDFCAVIERSLEEGPRFFPADMVTDQSEEFFVSELIREKVFDRLHKELPYSSAVRVERIEEEENLVRVAAVILVERESQKPIAVGAGGQTIKSIGTAARRDLERVFGMKVDLRLHVRVEKSWTRSKRGMGKAGYKI